MASYIGGFPLALDYTFTVPENVPAADKALFSWTWFNKCVPRSGWCPATDESL